MRRLAAVLALVVAVAAIAAVYAERLGTERQYRALLADGEAALQRNQTYVAIEAFSGALALRPDSMAAHYRRGQAYAAQRQDDRAVSDLVEATRLSPAAAEPLVALGAFYDDRGQPARAAEWYGQAADRLKDADPGVLYAWALSLYRAGSPAAARDPLRRLLARNDASPHAYYLLGLVLRDAQSPDEALAALEQAVRLEPGLVAAREELADLYRERGRPTDEMAQLTALAALEPGTSRRVAIGLAEAVREDYTSALDTLERANHAAPNDSRVYLAIGRVLLMRAERTADPHAVDRAKSALERALGGTARRSEGLALYGRALYLAGDAAGAERILQEAITTSPVDLEAYDFLADAAERERHPAVAMNALLDLDVLQGDTVSVAVRRQRQRRLGVLAMAAGERDAAVIYLAQAVEVAPDDAPLLGLLARARWAAGDRDGGRAAVARALELAPDDTTLQRLSRTMR